MRFCMVTTFYPPYHFGGDAIFVQRLSRALVARGHAVTVVHDVDAFEILSRGRPPEAAGASDGVEAIGLRSSFGALSPIVTQQTGRPLLNAGRLREILVAGRFDVIHFHNVSLVGGPGLLSYGSGLKLYTAHEHWLVCPTHVLWRHDREPCDRRECLRCVLAYRRPPQLWRYTGLLERSLADVDAFISPSEFSRQKHREFGFPRDMEVIPHFVPDPPEPAPHRPAPHERPYFLFVGRLEKLKGLQTLLPRVGRVGVDLLVAGDGEYGAELRRLAGDDPRIRFLGRVPAHDLDRYYRHAVAVVVPSIGYETFGMVVLESFRQSTPVVARRIGPLPELVDVSGGGISVDDDDGMVEAMRRLAADRGLRDRLGEAGHRALVERWSERAHMERYFALIGRLRAENSLS